MSYSTGQQTQVAGAPGQRRLSPAARLLVFLSDRFRPADFSRYADEQAYSRYQFARAEKAWNALLSRCLDVQGKSVVDLACGEGGKTVFYSTLGPQRIIGIDCAREKVERARHFAACRGAADCRFELGFAEDSGLPAGEFDLVISEDGFEHFPDPEAVLCEAQRLLRDGGQLLITFPPYWGPRGPHLGNFIRLPWPHLLFGWATMEQAVRHIAERMERQATDRPARESPTEQAERELHQLHGFINRMSLRRFKRMLMAHENWKLLRFHRFAGSRWALPFVLFRNMPLLAELGGAALVLLEKSPGQRITRSDFYAPRTKLAAPRII